MENTATQPTPYKRRRISADRWWEEYTPVKNHLDPNAGGDGCFFETYGAEFEFVRKMAAEAPDRVWTVLDVEGKLYISNGLHFVNRLNYLITEKSARPNRFYDMLYL